MPVHFVPFKVGGTAFLSLWTVMYLIPLWVFPYIPTEDGPSHVYNAVLRNALDSPGTRVGEFFELRRDFVPNITHQFVLALACRLVPPLIAEKLVLTLYVICFSAAFRYFLRGVAPDREYWTGWALLNVFNGSFWFGFYNYCISLILLFVTLGFWIRRHDRCNFMSSCALCVLLLLSLCTHLLGYCLSVATVAFLSLGNASGRRSRIVYATLAIAVTVPVLVNYLWRTGFWGSSGGGMAVLSHHLLRLRSDPTGVLERPLLDLTFHLFGVPGFRTAGLAMLLTVQVLLLVTLAEQKKDSFRSLPVVPLLACLGGIFAMLYFCVPNSFGPHGGFLQTRFACLPSLLWMACLAPPELPAVDRMVRYSLPILLVVNLGLTMQSFARANEELAEFVGGVPLVGNHCTVVTTKVKTNRVHPNHLANAGAFYCLGNGNVWIDNYEAQTSHFPIRYKEAFPRRDFDAPEVVLRWSDLADAPPPLPDYRIVYHNRRMSVLIRQDVPDRLE